MAALLVLGEAPVLDPSNPATWVQLGLAGVVMFAFAKGWVVSGEQLRREQKRADEANLAVREAIPALTRSGDVMERVVTFLEAQEKRPPRRGAS